MRQDRHQVKAAPTPYEGKKIGDMDADPTLHYVLIEKPTNAVPGYRPDYSAYRRDGYTKVSDDPNVTGKDEYELWACPKEKFESKQQEYVLEAQASAARAAAATPNSWEATEVGAPMTIAQLEQSIRPEQ